MLLKGNENIVFSEMSNRISFRCLLISECTMKNMNTDPSTAGSLGHRLICVLF